MKNKAKIQIEAQRMGAKVHTDVRLTGEPGLIVHGLLCGLVDVAKERHKSDPMEVVENICEVLRQIAREELEGRNANANLPN